MIFVNLMAAGLGLWTGIFLITEFHHIRMAKGFKGKMGGIGTFFIDIILISIFALPLGGLSGQMGLTVMLVVSGMISTYLWLFRKKKRIVDAEYHHCPKCGDIITN